MNRHSLLYGNDPAKPDGQQLRGVYITASARCAPPDNKPTPEEIRNNRQVQEAYLGAHADETASAEA